jgi:hypothetical protein
MDDIEFEKKNIDLSTPHNTEQISNDEEINSGNKKGDVLDIEKRVNSLGGIEIDITNKKVDQNVSISSESELQKKKKKEKSFRQRLQETCIKKVQVQRNIRIFALLFFIGLGLLLFSIAYIPLIFVSPSKFSTCISIGGILILISFLFYYGTKEYFSKIFSRSRFWVSIIFILSIIIGCIVSYKKYYLVSIICCGLEIFTLLFFLGSFIPGCNCAEKCFYKVFPKFKKDKEELKESNEEKY